MQARRVYYPERGRVALESIEVSPPGPGEVLVRNLVSMISPGTELAWLNAVPGTPGTFPQMAGYSSCGRVEACGAGVEGLRPGDRVVVSSLHQSVCTAAAGDGVCQPVPEGVAPEHAAAFMLVAIAMQAVRKGQVRLGSGVLVIGLGVIGNLAAQLARASGATLVAAADPVAWRGAVARQCGVDVVGASAAGLLAGEATHGPAGPLRRIAGCGFDVVIEATGAPEPINDALRAARRLGTVVLLGSTRGSTPQVDFYNDVHKKGLTVVGAHNSIRPLASGEDYGHLCSLRTDIRTGLELMAAGRLQVAPLVSGITPAEQAPAAYARLMDRREQLMTLALAWS